MNYRYFDGFVKDNPPNLLTLREWGNFCFAAKSELLPVNISKVKL